MLKLGKYTIPRGIIENRPEIAPPEWSKLHGKHLFSLGPGETPECQWMRENVPE
jgi:hypothetical protein